MQHGGGLYINNTKGIWIHKYDFKNNTATLDGGAIYISDSVEYIQVHGCGGEGFINNTAGNRGGAIFSHSNIFYFDGGNNDQKYINNNATNGGSAIYYIGDNFILKGTFINNVPWYHEINITEGYNIYWGDVENFTVSWHEGDNVIPGVYTTANNIGGSAVYYNSTIGGTQLINSNHFYKNRPDYNILNVRILDTEGNVVYNEMLTITNFTLFLFNRTIPNLAAGNYTIIASNTASGSVNTTFRVLNLTLNVTKSINNTEPNYGDYITYTIIVNNIGDSINEDVLLTEELPNSLKILSINVSKGLYNYSNNSWNIGHLDIRKCNFNYCCTY